MKFSICDMFLVTVCLCISPALALAQSNAPPPKKSFSLPDGVLRVCPERTSRLIIARFDERIEMKEGRPMLVGRLPLWWYGPAWEDFVVNCLTTKEGMTINLTSPVTDKSAIECQLLYPVKPDELAAAVRKIRDGQENAKFLDETTLGTRVVQHLRFDDDGRHHEAFACSLTDDCVGIVKTLESLEVLLKEIDSKDKKPAAILSLSPEKQQRLNGKACVMRWHRDGEAGMLREYATISQDEVVIYREHPPKEIAGTAWEADKFWTIGLNLGSMGKLAKVDDRTIRYAVPITPDGDGGQLILRFCLWVYPQIAGLLGR